MVKFNLVFLAVDLGGIKKFVLISWCGEGVTGMKKGYFNGQSQDVSTHFVGFHVQINARNEDDIDSNDMLSRVKKATGASFYKKHQAQDTQNNPESSSIKYEQHNQNQSTENKPAVSSIKYEQPNHNQSTENNPAVSSIKYEQRNHNQSTENNPAPSNIKYEQPSHNQSTENNPTPSRAPGRVNPPSQPPSQPPKSTPPPSKPVPPTVNAPPKPAPPTPVKAPEPVQEEYQEQIQEEEYQEQTQEEQYGGEEEYQEEATGGGVFTCKAIYAYQGEKEGDLSFNEGDLISILDESDPSGWWEGEVNGVRGYFPSNFVERV